LYLNALTGKGAHLVTVNDYLVKRDSEWMGQLYNFLGLSVGRIQNGMSDVARKEAYAADITYGTNNEFGFDYLRDNMKFNMDDLIQRELNYAIVDEVDSILIDEARTPLIISGPSDKSSKLYDVANRAVMTLSQADYDLDEKTRSVYLTEAGNDKIESYLRVDNLYTPDNILLLHHISQALRAHVVYRRDVDYMVQDGEVLIVDEFTGRILAGRRYSDGLHQALEAKEGVDIERENQTLASITLQNLFRLYKKLAGMTGTAETEASEFWKIYKLPVVVMPTNKPKIRKDEADIVFLTKHDKNEALIEDIKACHMRGQPVLVGTVAIESSEHLSNLLRQKGIPHNVLNAKQHEREASVVEEAGEKGRVTIATNMAGRGTDIKLGEGVRELGGLRIIGTERHESRRIDNQLRGRAGRQGDPGSSKFYIALEDDLMRVFGGERVIKIMERFGMKPGESIEDKWVSRSIEKAQERVEKQNFDVRKHLLEYDDVLNQQRKVVYHYRRNILEGSDQVLGLVRDMAADVLHKIFSIHCPGSSCSIEGREQVLAVLEHLTDTKRLFFEELRIDFAHAAKAEEQLAMSLVDLYEKIRGTREDGLGEQAEKWVLLETIDRAWRIHLQNIDHLREGIGLRGYGQKNPLIEYKKESFTEFERMMDQIKWDIVMHLFRMKPEQYSASALAEIERKHQRELKELQLGGRSEAAEAQPVRRDTQKIGRNDACSCGSGKKYKHCHGSSLL
jgi:preprotein translocase subunit SecA